jgi:outer membrane protein assembly factor BamB
MNAIRACARASRIAALCVIISAVFCSCGGNDWTSFRGNDGSGNSASSVMPPVGLRWKILLQKHVGQDRFFNQPVVANNTIYFGSSDGNFYSMDIRTGFMNWTVRTGGPVNSVPCVDAKNVYFGSSDGKVYAVARKTGKTSWTFATAGAVNSTLVLWRGMIVAAADTDAVYILSPAGKQLFRLSNEYWYHNSFQVCDDRIVFAPGSPDEPLNLAIFDLAKKRYLWSLESSLENYPWFSFPAVRGSRLYYSSTGLDRDGMGESSGDLAYKFYCLDFETGAVIWTNEARSVFSPGSDYSAPHSFAEGILLLDYGAPLLWRNRVIYACGDSMLRSFDSGDGREVWSREYADPLSSAVSSAGDRLYFGLRSRGEKGRLVCASASTGKELWSIAVEGSPLNSPVIAGSRIFFGTDAGYFYVLEEVP